MYIRNVRKCEENHTNKEMDDSPNFSTRKYNFSWISNIFTYSLILFNIFLVSERINLNFLAEIRFNRIEQQRPNDIPKDNFPPHTHNRTNHRRSSIF